MCFNVEKISFTENTTLMTIPEGQNATIWCEVKGEPMPNVTWLFNGQPISLENNIGKLHFNVSNLLF